MKKNLYIKLDNRALIYVSGPDALSFLQGLITNDIKKISNTRVIYALMLTPQGKFLYDFFIYEYGGNLLLDCNAAKLNEIITKLGQYKLRAKVKIEDFTNEYAVFALDQPLANTTQLAMLFNDPRATALPFRFIARKIDAEAQLKEHGFSQADFEYYENLRINLCIPSDLELADSFPLEYEMDKYNAIDYQKGCYVGQEVTARTHYRGTLRKKPYLVKATIDLSGYVGQEITAGQRKIGILRSASTNKGIALLHEEQLQETYETLGIGGANLVIVASGPS